MAAAGQWRLSQQLDLTPGLWWLIGGSLAFAGGVALSTRWSRITWISAWPGARPGSPSDWTGRQPTGALLIAFALGFGAAGLWILRGFGTPTSNLAALLWLAALLIAAGALLTGERRSTPRPPARPLSPKEGEASASPEEVKASPRVRRWFRPLRQPGGDAPPQDDATFPAPLQREAGGRPDAQRLGRWRTDSRLFTTSLLAAVFLVALALRLYQIGEVPFGVWFDEAETGLEARRLRSGETFYEPLSRNFGREPSLIFYLVAASFAIFGDSLFAVRFVTALLGALGAVAVTLLGREIFGWRVGLAAGLLLAVSRWHLDFSRFGMINVSAPLFAALCLWLLARAIRRESWADLGLSGLVLGLGLHGYAGFRPVVAALVIALLFGAGLRHWRPTRTLAAAGWWLALAALAGLPLILFAVQFPDEFNKRVGETFLLTGQDTLTEQVQAVSQTTRSHLLMFHYRGDPNGRHNLPGLPMLDPLNGLLLALGLAWAVVRWLDWRHLVLVVWGLAALSGGILSIAFEAPQGARTIAITPALALLSALGLSLALDRLSLTIDQAQRLIGRHSVRVRRIGPPIGALIAVAALGWIGWTTVEIYFTRQMPARASWLEYSPRETILALEAKALAAEYPRLLASQVLVTHPTIRFLAPEVSDPQPFNPVTDLPLRRDLGTLIFLDDRDRALWDEVLRFYPETPARQFSAPRDPQPVLAEFAISPELVRARRGLEAVYRSPDGTVRTGRDRSIDFDWRTAPPLGLPFSAEWSGGLVVPETGQYTVSVPEGFVLTLNGRAFAAAEWPEGVRLHLPQGNHSIHLTGEVTSPREVRLRWRTPSRSEFHDVPAALFYAGVPGGTGLLGRYFPQDNWSGAPAREQIDPVLAIYFHLLPLQRPYSVEWLGELEVPESGTYRIGVEQVSTASVWIDERLVLTNERRNQYADAEVILAAGRHPIRVRFRDLDSASHIYLFWTPPGESRQIIPGQYLYPPAPDPIPG